MPTKNQISLTRKVLYGIMLLGTFLAGFDTGTPPTAHTQRAGIAAPISKSEKTIAEDSLSYSVLYSDGSGIYTIDPITQKSVSLGNDFPVPTKFLLETDKISSSNELPDINITDGYIFTSGLLSPQGDQVIYVEAKCRDTGCENFYNVWILNLTTHQRRIIINESTNMTNLLPEPVAWNLTNGTIYFDTYDLANRAPYAGLWNYSTITKELSLVDLGFGYYNSRFWLSPDKKYLLTTGFANKLRDKLDAVENPTSLIKLIN